MKRDQRQRASAPKPSLLRLLQFDVIDHVHDGAIIPRLSQKAEDFYGVKKSLT